jgi:hypothetical protein
MNYNNLMNKHILSKTLHYLKIKNLKKKINKLIFKLLKFSSFKSFQIKILRSICSENKIKLKISNFIQNLSFLTINLTHHHDFHLFSWAYNKHHRRLLMDYNLNKKRALK